MDISSWFYTEWHPILRTVLVGLSAYISLIALLRVSGKRTLSKMNMFDWVVTVAMGSVMASILVSNGVTYVQGMTAFLTLIGAQWVVTTLSVRSTAFEKLVKAPPTILFYDGVYLDAAIYRERVPRSEILGAIRQTGQGAPGEVMAVLLESNGELVVLQRVDADQTATLEKANNWQSATATARQVQRREGV